MSMSVCGSVCLSVRIPPEPHACCMLPLSLARSSSVMFTIERIAYRREGVFFHLKMHYQPGKGKGVHRVGEVCYLRLPCVVNAVCDFLFVYEISPEPLNGFAPNSQGRRAWSLVRTSLKVKVNFGGLRTVYVWKSIFAVVYMRCVCVCIEL